MSESTEFLSNAAANVEELWGWTGGGGCEEVENGGVLGVEGEVESEELEFTDAGIRGVTPEDVAL